MGNPGSGESCILNAIAGELLFRSGVSVGEGLTDFFDVKTARGTKYCDTPGLSECDKTRLKLAGEEIRKSLNRGGPHKLLFFVRQDAGRPSLQDQTTMSLIHAAAEEIGSQYGVIVNKVSSNMIKKFKNSDDKKKFCETLFQGVPPTSNVIFLPKLEALDDADDQLVSISNLPGLEDFLRKLPVRQITKGRVDHIKVEQFDDTSEMIKALQNKLEEAAKKHKETEEELVEANRVKEQQEKEAAEKLLLERQRAETAEEQLQLLREEMGMLSYQNCYTGH